MDTATTIWTMAMRQWSFRQYVLNVVTNLQAEKFQNTILAVQILIFKEFVE